MQLCVGARAYRELDGCWFECMVVARDEVANTLSVQYCDDQRIEHELEPQDLAATLPSLAPEANCTYGVDAIQQTSKWALLLLSRRSGGSDSVLRRVLACLDQFEWLRSLALVHREWLEEICQRQNWTTLRFPSEILDRRESNESTSIGPAPYSRRLQRLMNVDLAQLRGPKPIDSVADSDHSVRNVVQHLICNDCEQLCDADVLQFVRGSRQVTRISLRRCSKVTFVLLYELIRMTKDRRSSAKDPLELSNSSPALVVDVWLCQGIPVEFVLQLQKNSSTRQLVRILGPGCSFVQASAQTHEWLQQAISASCTASVSTSNALVLLAKDSFNTEDTPKELSALKAQLARFPLTVIPVFCRPPRSLRSTTGNSDGKFAAGDCPLVLIPTTVEDFVRLVEEFESSDTLEAVQRLIASGIVDEPEAVDPAASTSPDQQPDDLQLRAQRVFAMLHKTTQDLENQVAHLEEQVKVMTLAKDAAQKEYSQAQEALDQIAKDANRALLSLANASLPPPPAPICDSSSSILKDKDGDEMLPILPSLDQIYSLGQKLETELFAVLDSFLGGELSSQLRMIIDELYETSIASNSSTDQEMEEKRATFTRGELAGGKTGQNLRYQMAHVRGDYVLWIDEFDSFCPPVIRQVLRQLDRLVLERLPRYNAELGRASLLRKKAMITCYPGHQTRYTKHCDNPNQNGRKVREKCLHFRLCFLIL